MKTTLVSCDHCSRDITGGCRGFRLSLSSVSGDHGGVLCHDPLPGPLDFCGLACATAWLLAKRDTDGWGHPRWRDPPREKQE